MYRAVYTATDVLTGHTGGHSDQYRSTDETFPTVFLTKHNQDDEISCEDSPSQGLVIISIKTDKLGLKLFYCII